MDDLRGFAVEVAAFLPGWAFDEVYWNAYRNYARLVNPEIPGAMVYMQCSRGRVEVSGGYPNGFHPSYEERVRISVSMERTAADVARDIERRFLGGYLEKYCAAVDAAYRAAQAQARAQDVADELAMILGEGVRHGRDESSVWSRHGTFRVMSGSDGPYITVERIHGVSVALAKALARVIAEG